MRSDKERPKGLGERVGETQCSLLQHCNRSWSGAPWRPGETAPGGYHGNTSARGVKEEHGGGGVLCGVCSLSME